MQSDTDGSIKFPCSFVQNCEILKENSKEQRTTATVNI